jgi:twitching motility protein PilT
VIFERDLELDFALTLPGTERFRVNIHLQQGAVEAAIRRVPDHIPSLDELGLPPAAAEFARLHNGLVLVTGATGMGKTTTLAAMVQLINEERERLIITIEDPVEFVHTNRRSIIKQREVYADTRSFAVALRHVLRQDPDVIVVGEMRDLETISTALTAAETGHLVLATLHTSDAPSTISRIIDVFPPHQQAQVVYQLADCLGGIITQQLLPHRSGSGRVLATEVLVATSAARHLIREQQLQQIPSLLQTNAKIGMRTMDRSLQELYAARLITRDAAMNHAKDPTIFPEEAPAPPPFSPSNYPSMTPPEANPLKSRW